MATTIPIRNTAENPMTRPIKVLYFCDSKIPQFWAIELKFSGNVLGAHSNTHANFVQQQNYPTKPPKHTLSLLQLENLTVSMKKKNNFEKNIQILFFYSKYF